MKNYSQGYKHRNMIIDLYEYLLLDPIAAVQVQSLCVISLKDKKSEMPKVFLNNLDKPIFLEYKMFSETKYFYAK